jgi:hypothetical protein
MLVFLAALPPAVFAGKTMENIPEGTSSEPEREYTTIPTPI